MARDVVLSHPGTPDAGPAEVAARADVLALPRPHEVVQAAAAREGGIVSAFIAVSLWFFAACALMGMLAPFAIAARHRTAGMAAVALIIAAWVIFILLTAAGNKR